MTVDSGLPVGKIQFTTDKSRLLITNFPLIFVISVACWNSHLRECISLAFNSVQRWLLQCRLQLTILRILVLHPGDHASQLRIF